VVTGGWLDGGNFAGVATRALSRGRLGEDGPDKQGPSISDGMTYLSRPIEIRWLRSNVRYELATVITTVS
jgi:hypothetical protein